MKNKVTKLIKLFTKSNIIIKDFIFLLLALILTLFLFYLFTDFFIKLVDNQAIYSAVKLNINNFSFSKFTNDFFIGFLALFYKIIHLFNVTNFDEFYESVFFNPSVFQITYIILCSFLVFVTYNITKKIFSSFNPKNNFYTLTFLISLLSYFIFGNRMSYNLVLGLILILYIFYYSQKYLFGKNIKLRLLILLLTFAICLYTSLFSLVFITTFIVVFILNFFIKKSLYIQVLLNGLVVALVLIIVFNQKGVKREDVLNSEKFISENFYPSSKLLIVGDLDSLPNLFSSNKTLYEFKGNSKFNSNYNEFNLYSDTAFLSLFFRAHDNVKNVIKYDSLYYSRGVRIFELLNYCFKNSIDTALVSNQKIMTNSFISKRIFKRFGETIVFVNLSGIGLCDTIKSIKSQSDYLINATICLKFGLTKQALRNYSKVLNDKNIHSELFAFIANLYADNGEYNRAINIYSFLIRKFPLKYKYLKNRANLFYVSKYFKSAAADFTLLLSRKIYNSDIFYKRAICYMKMNRSKRTIINDLSNSIKLGNNKDAKRLLELVNSL